MNAPERSNGQRLPGSVTTLNWWSTWGLKEGSERNHTEISGRLLLSWNRLQAQYKWLYSYSTFNLFPVLIWYTAKYLQVTFLSWIKIYWLMSVIKSSVFGSKHRQENWTGIAELMEMICKVHLVWAIIAFGIFLELLFFRIKVLFCMNAATI